MTEEIASTPGWVDEKLDRLFADLPDEAQPLRDGYAACLARQKAPAAPSDLLGAEFESCRATLRRGISGLALDAAVIDRLDAALEALEAEIAGQS